MRSTIEITLSGGPEIENIFETFRIELFVVIIKQDTTDRDKQVERKARSAIFYLSKQMDNSRQR
jgi:hypothetical protein